MRIVLQRVKHGSVTVMGKRIAEIGKGLVILLGIGPEDTEAVARAMAEKVALLRIFEDEEGKMNLSVRDVEGAAIVVSQFTLYADASKGRRPSFTGAAAPDKAKLLVERFASFLGGHGVPTQMGEFGAEMQVELLNDGPVTIVLEQ
jgi:D-tyrosyl-tRNA(Tyr) deacylase